MRYFPCDDQMWNEEVKSILGYCLGYGIDVGCGDRTLFPHLITVDNHSDEAEIKAEADDLPFKEGEFDFVYATHCIEHLKDPLKAINEWLRVVKKGGHVIIICPDKRFTPSKGMAQVDPQHKWEFQYEELAEICRLTDGYQVNKDVWALPNYSFKIILRKA
jgi:predicted SAM-dependent methyltransferase